MWFGAGREADNAVFLLIGSGVGASVIANGAPYRGVSSSAGEWGHTTARIGGRRCRCGAEGCLEAYIGSEAVIARFREELGLPQEILDEEKALRDIVDLAARASADTESADEDDMRVGREEALAARRVLDETAVHIGVGIANLVNLLNPERVIIGGWAGVMLGTGLLPDIQRTVKQHALRHSLSQTRVELCRLGGEAVARGAATLPVAHFLDSGGFVGEPPAGRPSD
jgi:predicted NBD/HSP70 family sugar kinase